MTALENRLVSYAEYHRDARNIATHFVGIPMIVLAVAALMSRPIAAIGNFPLTPFHLLVAATTLYYLRLSVKFAALMFVLLLLAAWFGEWTTSLSGTAWLAVGVGGFIVGWVFQFIGHYWEGRKPAFVDDLAGLIIGPLFVVIEALFVLGLCASLRQTIESRAGTIRHSRRDA